MEQTTLILSLLSTPGLSHIRFPRSGGYKEMSSVFADQQRPSYTSPNVGGGRVAGSLSANEYSCAHHVTWGPNKFWRSTSIFT
jgi:hypothetical protein